MRRIVPLRHNGKHVGEAVIEVDQEGCRVLSTNITDSEIKEKFEKDILRLQIPLEKRALDKYYRSGEIKEDRSNGATN